MGDYYEILGVSPDATTEEIKAARKALLDRYHPDRFQGDPRRAQMEVWTTEINIAYDTLSDRQKRADYDRDRLADRHRTNETASSPPPPPPPPRSGAGRESSAEPPPAPQRKPSRAMWAASAIGVAVLIALVRAAWIADEQASPPDGVPNTNGGAVQAKLSPEPEAETPRTKPLRFSAKTYAIDGDYDRGFIPLTEDDCWKSARVTPESPYRGVVEAYNDYFTTHKDDAIRLTVGTHFKPYLRPPGDLHSAVWFGSMGNQGGFLAEVLDGPQKQTCGFIEYGQLSFIQFLEKNPDYPRAKRIGDAIMARITYTGPIDGFRAWLRASFARRAKELDVDPESYAPEIDAIVDIASLCGSVDLDRLKSATDEETGNVVLSRLGPEYARCDHDIESISPKEKYRAVFLTSLYSTIEGRAPVFYLSAWIRPLKPPGRSIFDTQSDMTAIRWGFLEAHLAPPPAASHT